MQRALAFLLAALMVVPPAYGQAADPTDIKLVPRSLSLEVDDPDIHVKKAANDIVNEVILTDPKFKRLLVLSYNRILTSVNQFNTTNYGTSTVFLKGGNALRHAYATSVRPWYERHATAMLAKCDPLFGQSDIDYAVTTAWNSAPQTASRDFWLRDPTSNNEYGYQILNSLVIEAMDKLRSDLLWIQNDIAFANPAAVPTTSKYMTELRDSFAAEDSTSFVQKWADYRAAKLLWYDVPLPNEPVYMSHQLQEYKGQPATRPLFDNDEMLGFYEDDEVKKYNDIRNTALPDKVILEGPTPQLLYSYQRNYHISSIYLTSNYSETWPSDPTIDPTHYTKFALHRLKLSLPFRIVMAKTGGNASKPFKKLLGKSFQIDTQTVGNVLTVGGELVDVGVDHPSATVLGHPPIAPRDLVDIDVAIGTDMFTVKAAGFDWLAHDLKDVIFDIVGMPWKKKKFEKRAGRFMCLIGPKLADLRAVNAVSVYLQCLAAATNLTQIDACVRALPSGLDQYPYILDFLAGWDPVGRRFDLNRHSLVRVMTRLPGAERTNATNYLAGLRNFL